jgi:hypothetical protein
MNGQELRVKRVTAGISGDVLHQAIGVHPSRLSRIERGSLRPAPGEMERLGAAIEDIIETRQHLAKLATEAGLDLRGVRW